MVTNTILEVYQEYRKKGGMKDAGDVTLKDILAVRSGLAEVTDDLGNTDYLGTDQQWKEFEESKSFNNPMK